MVIKPGAVTHVLFFCVGFVGARASFLLYLSQKNTRKLYGTMYFILSHISSNTWPLASLNNLKCNITKADFGSKNLEELV